MNTKLLAIRSRNSHEAGVVLIVVLLLLILISGLAAGVAYMAMTQTTLSGSDMQSNKAYSAAEAGLESMTAALADLYQAQQTPSVDTIKALGDKPPAIPGVTWLEYKFDVAPDPNNASLPATYSSTISGGAQNGLAAQIIPISLQATAQLSDGSQSRMFRRVEVALIPVFQYGVFCDMDCSYHAGDDFDFRGRVHTNGNLFLLADNDYQLVFHDKITVGMNQAFAAGIEGSHENAVVTDRMPNGEDSHKGKVYIPVIPNGCDISTNVGKDDKCSQIGNGTNWAPKATNHDEGSVSGGLLSWTPAGTDQGSSVFEQATTGTMARFHNYIQYKVTPLELPFIPTGSKLNNATPLPIEIIRRRTSDKSDVKLDQARLYNQATIRVLFEDDPAKFENGTGATDPENVALEGTFDVTGQDPTGANGFFKPGYINLGTYGQADSYVWMPIATATNGKLVTKKNLTCGTGTKKYSAYTTPLAIWNFSGTTLANIDPYSKYPGYTKASQQAVGPLKCVGDSEDLDTQATAWPLLTGFLRVEIRTTAAGGWVPVTREWLKLGFTRGSAFPDSEHGVTNVDYPNSILLLQQWADHNFDGKTSCLGAGASGISADLDQTIIPTDATPVARKVLQNVSSPTTSAFPVGSSCYNKTAWKGSDGKYYYPASAPYSLFPLNFYDAREGEVRTKNNTTTDCSLNGVMNVSEIDVGNLRKWLMGKIGTSGPQAISSYSNGYILYFSDRRGNEKLGDKGYRDGGYDYLDTINWEKSDGAANNKIELDTYGNRPENVYATPGIPAGNFGLFVDPIKDTSSNLLKPPSFIGVGFGQAKDIGVFNRITCSGASTGAAIGNVVMGPRHSLRLVNGSLGNLPTAATDDDGNFTGGFTVASEQNVYLLGNYNALDGSAWDTRDDQQDATDNDAAAAIIADAVTVLSQSWKDINSFQSPDNPSGRKATTTYYRAAIAAGKNRLFKGSGDWGSDGGVHNFLRYLEDWSGTSKPKVYYKGSLVSLWYSAYATGVHGKGNIYGVPAGGRKYSFDRKFENPNNMPPGTPQFIQVVNTAFRQDTMPQNREAAFPAK